MKTKFFLIFGLCLTVFISLYVYWDLKNRNTVTNFFIKQTVSKTKNSQLEVSYKILDSVANILSAYNLNTNDSNKLNQLFDRNINIIYGKIEPSISDTLIKKVSSILIFNSLLKPFGIIDSSVNGCASIYIKKYDNVYSILNSPYFCCSDFTLLSAKIFDRYHFSNSIINLNFHTLNLIRLSSTRSLYIDPTAGIIFDMRFGNRKQSKFYYLPLYGIYDNKFHRNSILPLRNLVTFILFDVENFDKHFISEQSYNTFEKQNYLNIE